MIGGNKGEVMCLCECAARASSNSERVAPKARVPNYFNGEACTRPGMSHLPSTVELNAQRDAMSSTQLRTTAFFKKRDFEINSWKPETNPLRVSLNAPPFIATSNCVKFGQDTKRIIICSMYPQHFVTRASLMLVSTKSASNDRRPNVVMKVGLGISP